MINGMRVQTKVKQETKYVNLKIGTHEEMIHFNIMPLDPYELVLGIPWLRKHNPEVDQVKGTFSFPKYLDNLDCSNESYKLDDLEKEYYNNRNNFDKEYSEQQSKGKGLQQKGLSAGQFEPGHRMTTHPFPKIT